MASPRRPAESASPAPGALALAMAPEAITLHRWEDDWEVLGIAQPDTDGFAEQIAALRDLAGAEAAPVTIWLPDDQVLVRKAVIAEGADGARHEAATEVLTQDGSVTRAEIEVAVSPPGDDGGAICLAILTQTREEAESYARKWGFEPELVTTRTFAARFPGFPVFETAPVVPVKAPVAAAAPVMAAAPEAPPVAVPEAAPKVSANKAVIAALGVGAVAALVAGVLWFQQGDETIAHAVDLPTLAAAELSEPPVTPPDPFATLSRVASPEVMEPEGPAPSGAAGPPALTPPTAPAPQTLADPGPAVARPSLPVALANLSAGSPPGQTEASATAPTAPLRQPTRVDEAESLPVETETEDVAEPNPTLAAGAGPSPEISTAAPEAPRSAAVAPRAFTRPGDLAGPGAVAALPASLTEPDTPTSALGDGPLLVLATGLAPETAPFPARRAAPEPAPAPEEPEADPEVMAWSAQSGYPKPAPRPDRPAPEPTPQTLTPIPAALNFIDAPPPPEEVLGLAEAIVTAPTPTSRPDRLGQEIERVVARVVDRTRNVPLVSSARSVRQAATQSGMPLDRTSLIGIINLSTG
ncbi:MAG: hypothetical protein AAF568_02555, partial [Pseudomonadota bacterium]